MQSTKTAAFIKTINPFQMILPACKNIPQNSMYISCFQSYAFTSKERDRETGFSYFGARYYDSDLSGLFLSVDPMSDKYPSISPYAYCAWNPVKLVDPNGMEIGDYYAKNSEGIWEKIGSDGNLNGKVYIVLSREAQEKVKKGDYNLDKNESFELPSCEARNEMCEFLETSEKIDNLREYGGQIWEDENSPNKQTIRRALPGDKWEGKSFASCDPTDDGNAGFVFVEKQLLTNFHSHFSGMINGLGLEQYPSDAYDGRPHDFKKGDIQNVVGSNGQRLGGARLPYNIMVAMRDRIVFLYTETGVKCTMSIETFRTIGGNGK